MTIIWFLMLVAALSISLFTSPTNAVNAMISGANNAVELSLNLVALYGFWLGFFSLVERLGLSRILEKLLRPITKRLFPSSDEQTRKYITMNFSANLLGLGNAATPMAINAIKLMDKGDRTASTDMIMLTVISATSLQLLPTTVIGLRATVGSANPTDFLFPSLVATTLSTLIGIVGVKLCSKLFDRKKNKNTTVSHSTNRCNTTLSKNALTKNAFKIHSLNKCPNAKNDRSRKNDRINTSIKNKRHDRNAKCIDGAYFS